MISALRFMLRETSILLQSLVLAIAMPAAEAESLTRLFLSVSLGESLLRPVPFHLIARSLPVGGPLGVEGRIAQQTADPAAHDDGEPNTQERTERYPRGR
jgi:hypothetical protein